MGLFTSREAKQAKEIMSNFLLNCSTDSLRGINWNIEINDNCVFFTCDEDNFSSGLKRYLGYGDYQGNFMIIYNPKEKYLVLDVYFGQNVKPYSQLKTNAEFAKSTSKCDIILQMTETQKPYLHISKIIAPNTLQEEIKNLALAFCMIVE